MKPACIKQEPTSGHAGSQLALRHRLSPSPRLLACEQNLHRCLAAVHGCNFPGLVIGLHATRAAPAAMLGVSQPCAIV